MKFINKTWEAKTGITASEVYENEQNLIINLGSSL